ncbi:hypothetical protein F4809DRAFT_654824 [Biscogniauxia mediterranea]|nr:hypothetical protein F4809DRAFT_654824 [Biscogniauxia mediterranea]
MNAQPRTTRQPKLRSSCDGCGSAKLKCDRGQPECGRCVSLGITCVYGVSRKMGKPPRERLQMSATPGQPRAPREQDGAGRGNRHRGKSHSRCTSGSISDTMLSRSRSNSSVNEMPSAWGSVDEYPGNLVMDAFHNDQLGPSLTNFTSLDPGDWIMSNTIGDDLSSTNLDPEPFPPLGWPEFESSPDSTGQATGSHPLIDERGYLDSSFMMHDDGKAHDCSREAYEILGSLSLPNFNKAHSANTSAPSSTAGSANNVPLDFVLHLNREASERLGCLLSCPCASQPHLAFLYATILSRILLWYHQEASSPKPSARSPPSEASIRAGMSPPSSVFGSVGRSPSSWLSAATSTTNTTASGSSTPSGVVARMSDMAPTQMSMGCFSIDDQQVQTALRIQLLLGEMKRISCLIDAFTSRGSSGMNDSSRGNVDAVYKSLGSLLGGEHSNIIEMMRTRLKEVSMYYMGV